MSAWQQLPPLLQVRRSIIAKFGPLAPVLDDGRLLTG
jgi:hypothetical protein